MSVIQVPSHKFCNDHPIAFVMISINEVSKHFDLELKEYWEDGLGAASCCLIKTSRGYIYFLKALEARQEKWGPHFEVRADAIDIVDVGVDALVADLKSTLSLSEDYVTMTDTTMIEKMAKVDVDYANDRRNDRDYHS